ncbi:MULTISPECIES: wax ester/triacylglycerol synthase family O-acyltransferase [unclassified Streptomyces]|uniref:wax ester/triacylglycerol synthase family O-acyltransferase n=1 Tax=unclassified Streptomyces TaxID=2593676 RepID=UPI0033A8EB8C
MTTELLAPLDLAFWHLESTAHPLHLGALAHFGPVPAPPGGEPADVLELLARRAAAVPRLRMRVRDVLIPVGGAAWSADPDFDVRRHVREITLPGADFPAETTRLAAELMERPVERGLPPWEMYLLSGAPDGSFAVLVKLHHALADGMRAVAIGAGIFDEIAAGHRPARRPRPVPPRSPLSGLPGLPGPGRLLGIARDRLGDLGRAVEVGASVVRASRLDGRPTAALAAHSSGTRRIATATLSLDRVHRVRRATGGTANDVLLAVVAGALRRWFGERGLPLPGADPRALVPVSRRRPGAPPGPGNSLSGYLLDLPVTEPDPAARLAAVRRAMDRNKAAGPFRGAGAVALLADQLPPLAHRFGAPFASGAARLLFDLLVTQVPLPRSALSLGGAPLRALFPMAPLARGQSLAVAMSPYGGRVHIGLVADGAAVPDLDALAAALTAELDLLDPPENDAPRA